MRQLSLVKSLSATLGTESGFWLSSALAVQTGFAGNSHAWWALYALIFWGREKRRRSSREGTGNKHSGTFHDPGATSGKHQSLQFQHYICISRINATSGTGFPKNRCSSFLLVKNSKFPLLQGREPCDPGVWPVLSPEVTLAGEVPAWCPGSPAAPAGG